MAAEPARTLVLNVHGPLRRSGLPGLFAHACGLLGEHEPDLVVCEVAGVDADAVAVDALARLGLAARRYGARVRLQGASPALHEIVAFAGLSKALPAEVSYESSLGGSPKSGKMVSVSRKNVSSTILPPSSSSTWRAHGS